jgi:hypothetical protein
MVHARRGISRPDVAAILVAVSVLMCGLLAPTMARQRQAARHSICDQNLRLIGAASIEDAESRKEEIPNLSWHSRDSTEVFQWQRASIGLADAQARAVEELRRLTRCESLQARSDWLPQVRYTWLALAPEERHDLILQTVCPEDAELRRLRWKHLPVAMGAEKDPAGRGDSPDSSLAAYRSTYEFVPASWSQDYGGADSRGEPTPIVEQGTTDSVYRVPRDYPFGKRVQRLGHVLFPSQKVYVYDPIDRHAAVDPIPYADPRAVQPVLFFDGSVRMLATVRCNPGSQPNGYDPGPTKFKFFWATETGGALTHSADVQGFYRWTLGGLGGIDSEGREYGRLRKAPSLGRDFVEATP